MLTSVGAGMFGGGFNSSKLKTNLRLCINRLKLLQKKKTELNVKARKEIAGYLAQNKDDRARIKVEHIIRDDYLIEAMECLELYCDLLLARIGLIETQKYCDEGLATPVCTLIWVAPRMQQDVAEFKQISDLLSAKFGKDFAQQARNNTNGAVDPRIKNKITLQQPSPFLVEQYLIEIANVHGINFEPRQDIIMAGDPSQPPAPHISPKGDDYMGPGSGGGGGGGGGGNALGAPPPAPGFASFEDFVSGPPQMNAPPLPPAAMNYSDTTSQGVATHAISRQPSRQLSPLPSPQPSPRKDGPGPADFPVPTEYKKYDLGPSDLGMPGSSMPGAKSAGGLPMPPGAGSAGSSSQGAPPPPPGLASLPYTPPAPPTAGQPQPPSYSESNFQMPNLPSVPSNSFPPNDVGSESVDFDDLNRRFEELKKRK